MKWFLFIFLIFWSCLLLWYTFYCAFVWIGYTENMRKKILNENESNKVYFFYEIYFLPFLSFKKTILCIFLNFLFIFIFFLLASFL